MAAERSVIVRIKAEFGSFKADMDAMAKAAESAGKKTESAGNKASTAMGRLANDAKNHEQSWSTVSTSLVGVGAAVVAMVGISVAKYAEFEQAVSKIGAATHASAADMDRLRSAAISAGADTAFSATEAANAIEELAKAGVSTADILDGGLDGAMALAAAGGLGVAAAAEIASTQMVVFGLQGRDLVHVADLLAAGAGKAQGGVEDLALGLKYIGPVAAGMGVSIEETTGALAMFASQGILGEQAGTSLRGVLSSLTSPSKLARKEIESLGIQLYDSEGKFLGINNAAGQLKSAYEGMDDAQRDMSLGLIFGNAQVTAARILYKEGAEGVDKWTAAVNDAGYAALTAQIMQDNLLGDVEKLGGAFDTVFIKSGGGAAEALRGLTKGAESVIDSIGKLDPAVLSTVGGIAGIVGVAALATGGFMKLVPAAIDTFQAFRDLGTSGGKITGTLGKVAKGAIVAAGALVAIQIIGQIFTDEHVASATDYAEAILKVSEAGKDAKASDLNGAFSEWTKLFGSNRVNDVYSMADAVKKIANPSWGAQIDKNLNFLNGFFNLPDSELVLLEERFDGLGESMANLASNGNAEAAAQAFRLISTEFEANGKSAQAALDVMPAYADALTGIAHEAGVVLTPAERLNWALTGIEPASVAAAKGAAEAKTALSDMGIAADGAVESIDKMLESMFALGDGTLSVRAANRDLEESIDSITESIEKNGKSLDNTTPKGRANEAALDGIAIAGKKVAESMATATDENGNMVYSNQEIQDTLTGTYNSLITAAGQYGITGQKAKDLARDVLGVPEGVDIKTWMDDYAADRAENLSNTVDSMPNLKEVTILVTDDGTVELTKGQVQSIEDRTVGVQVTDDGTILTVQGGIDGVSGKDEYVRVNDDGTIQIVQAQINGVTGKTEFVHVSDNGTVAGVQNLIDRIRDGYASIHVTTINQVRNLPATGPGGRGGPTKMNGGQLPKNAAGSKLPTTGPGTDTTDGILGMTADGTPLSWLDGGEWVINRKSSDKHNRLLSMINRNDPRIDKLSNLVGLQGLAKGGRAYRIKSGDTLSEIGEQFGVSWRTLQKHNNIQNANRIYAGQTIYIPGGGSSSSISKPKPKPKPKPPAKPVHRTTTQWAQREADGYAQDVKDLQSELKKDEAREKAAQKAYDKAKSKSGKASAKKKLDAAKKEVTRTEKLINNAQEKLRDAKAKAARLSEMEFEVKTDLRRGNITDAFKSGSGLNVVDDLISMSRNQDFSKKQRSALAASAKALEKDLGALEKRAASVTKKLESATAKRDELLAVKENVAASLRSEWNLGSMLEWDTLKSGPLTAKQINAAAKTKANQFKAFAGKIEALRKKGFSASVIQEVVDLGVNEGTYVADALLKSSGAEVKALNQSYKDMDTYTNAAGVNVTNAMYKGGINAAEGLVKGLQSQEKQIDAAFYKLGKTAEAAYKRALGIKSPSRVMMQAGRDTAKGAELGILDGTPAVQAAMSGMFPDANDSMKIETNARNNASGSGRSSTPQVVQHNEFHYPIAENTSKGVERANQLMTI